MSQITSNCQRNRAKDCTNCCILKGDKVITYSICFLVHISVVLNPLHLGKHLAGSESNSK